FLSLTLKESSKKIEYKKHYYSSVEVIQLFEKAIPSIEMINRFQNSESLIIYISETIPDILIRNEIEKNKQCLIVAENQDDIFIGIMKIYPIVKGEIIL